MGGLTAKLADRLATQVLANVARPYPHKSGVVLRGDEDVLSPAARHPIFSGCFDWHSAVHSHWTLARLVRLMPGRPWQRQVSERFRTVFTDENISWELATLREQPGFEIPYGLVWLLTLSAELDHDFHGEPWARSLRPLEALAAERLESWLRQLSHAIRSGQHPQSAFSMSLLMRWAETRGERSVAKLVRHRAVELHQGDRRAPINSEPSAHDFLSPVLAVAELMTAVLPARDYGRWLDDYLPGIDGAGDWLVPVTPVDRADGKLAHFDGLNLSRAWMLRAMSAALLETDQRSPWLTSLARKHGERGLEGLGSDEYAVTHWLPSFALYWLTGPGS